MLEAVVLVTGKLVDVVRVAPFPIDVATGGTSAPYRRVSAASAVPAVAVPTTHRRR